MKTQISKQVEVVRTARVMQMEGIFQMAPTLISDSSWDVDLPIEDWDWKVGLIVGPSGSGKTTVARHAFKDAYWADEQTWAKGHSVVDGFPAEAGIKSITAMLSSVGFSSPPAWLRPFSALSTGEQFRVTVARALMEAELETNDIICIDEFTSVIDRQVAQIGSASVAKAIRRSKSARLVAVSCHSDIIEWLQPDWIYEPATNTFSRRSVRRRPNIELEIYRTTHATWDVFRKHHYLDFNLNKGAKCFVGCINGRPAGFIAVLMFPHRVASAATWRISRTVCLPDFQGLGIGTLMMNYVASLFEATIHHCSAVTGHPSLTASLFRSDVWEMRRKPGVVMPSKYQGPTAATTRMTAGFRYIGPAREQEAKRFGVIA